MSQVEFKAWDYTKDDEFIESHYRYIGDEETGWEIYRNDELYLKLDPGYKLLKTKSCGICSTDIDRRFLPFPLPQIIGHEVIAGDTDGQSYVVEINDTFSARGSQESDPFVSSGIPTHSPERKVLGIDRLPGGFGPYLLAPKYAILPYSGIPDRVAVLIEPFAAALQAILASPPGEGDSVAVLGPRRLGSLILSALSAYRSSSGKKFQITALTRRDELSQLALKLGADSAINIAEEKDREPLKNSFSIVYDTTATPEGFLTALDLAEREVHLKTTNGRVMGGLNHLTELVVDELSILPFQPENLEFHWEREPRLNSHILISKNVSDDRDSIRRLEGLIQDYFQSQGGFAESSATRSEGMQKPGALADILTPEEAWEKLESFQNKSDSGERESSTDLNFANRLPRYDLAIVGDFSEIERCIRPREGSEESLVRPRGAILYLPSQENSPPGSATEKLNAFFMRGGCIRSSRCGDFQYALKLLQENPKVVEALEKNMVSHEFSIQDLPSAYKLAQTPEAIKVVVNHDE